MDSYKDLRVYQKSYEAAKHLYQVVSETYPCEERYGLTSQI